MPNDLTLQLRINAEMTRHLDNLLEGLLYVKAPAQTEATTRGATITTADIERAYTDWHEVRAMKLFGVSREKAALLLADNLVTFMEFGYSEAAAREMRRITDALNADTVVWKISDLEMVKLILRYGKDVRNAQSH